jgi:pimeloyl-ACP methyl ester carboxylesterase
VLARCHGASSSWGACGHCCDADRTWRACASASSRDWARYPCRRYRRAFAPQDLKGVTLVGHSYGGTVITAAAELVPDRIGRLVYLDAAVPRDGESNNDVVGPELAADLREVAKSAGEGWRVPPPAPSIGSGLPDSLRSWIEERLTPHPLRSFDQPVHLRSPVAAALPRAFIRTSRQSALYAGLMERAQKGGWICRDLEGGHYPMFSEPRRVAWALAELSA